MADKRKSFVESVDTSGAGHEPELKAQQITRMQEIRDTLAHVVAQGVEESLTQQQREYFAPILKQMEIVYIDGLKQVLYPGLPRTRSELDTRIRESQAEVAHHLRAGCEGAEPVDEQQIVQFYEGLYANVCARVYRDITLSAARETNRTLQ